MNIRGFTTLMAMWILMFFFSGIFITTHFVAQRNRAIQRLEKIEMRLNRLHQKGFTGKRKFWPSFDRPPAKQGSQKVTHRKEVKKHWIAIDFGEGDSHFETSTPHFPR